MRINPQDESRREVIGMVYTNRVTTSKSLSSKKVFVVIVQPIRCHNMEGMRSQSASSPTLCHERKPQQIIINTHEQILK